MIDLRTERSFAVSNSNKRNKMEDTVHHLTSRIAHRVYFLKDDERNDLLEIVRRAAEFCGLTLLGWCVMTNHFHLLVYLPERVEVDEAEVLRRYGLLKGKAALGDAERSFAEWRKAGENGERRIAKWLASQRRRMYDVGSFMKIVKQWFTEEYNRRNGHSGTLWESAYHDRIVPNGIREISECLGYIHLNPIRAAVADTFDGYAWSSYAAFRRGDDVALDGMRFIYGDECDVGEIRERHEGLLACLLEKEKLRRATEIVRRRQAGYDVPADPLTTEAYLQQAAVRLEEVRQEALRLREARLSSGMNLLRNSDLEREVVAVLTLNPSADALELSKSLSVSVSSVYKLLGTMVKKGTIVRAERGTGWRVV